MELSKVYSQKEALEKRLYRMFKKFEADNNVVITDVAFDSEDGYEYDGIVLEVQLHNEYKNV